MVKYINVLTDGPSYKVGSDNSLSTARTTALASGTTTAIDSTLSLNNDGRLFIYNNTGSVITISDTTGAYTQNISASGTPGVYTSANEFNINNAGEYDNIYSDSTTYNFLSTASTLKLLSSSSTFLTFTDVCFPPFTKVKTDKGLIEIGDLKRGDLVITKRGLIPVTKNLNTGTPFGTKFVKFPKNIFSPGIPKEDLYMTKAHAFSLGLKEGTDDVWLWLEACQFIGKFGIEEVFLKTKSYHNLIFDDQEEFYAEGMKVFSHHPNGNPYILPKDEYLNKVNEEERKIEALSYEIFIKNKPEDQDEKEYIAEKLKFE